MKLRIAQPSDASCLAAISIEVWLGAYIRRGVTAFFADYALSAFTAQRFETLMNAPGEHFLVSENVEGIDGYIRISSQKAMPAPGHSTTEIATLYIQPRHRRKGIGAALLDAALRHARRTGAESVWLAANSENLSAIDFYLSQGFEKAGVTHFRIQDRTFPNDVLLRAF